MKTLLQYVFKPEDIGRKDWPSGELRLDGIEKTEDPTMADIFVCPGPLCMFTDDQKALERFPYIKGKEDRLVCFDVSDYDTVFTLRDPILIRCNLKKFMLEAHPNSIAWSWPVENFAECVSVPDGGFKYDVSFQGWLSSDSRKLSVTSFEGSNLRTDFACYSDFCGYIFESAEGVRRRAEFRRSMRESRIALCPQSIDGCLPYRFFEAMSAGRIPLLVGWDYNLPFAEQIPYDDFILTTTHPDKTAEIAASFLKSYSDEQIIEKGLQARGYFERYLDPDKWPTLMTQAVERKLAR